MSAPTTSAATMKGPEDTDFYTKTWTPSGDGIAVFAYDGRGFGQTAAAKKGSQGVTSWPQQLADLSFFINNASTLHPNAPLYLFGHSMGGALVLAWPTRSPAPAGLEKIKGVISSSPLLRQARGVKASPLLVRAGSILGKISSKLTIKAEVKPEHICRDPEIQAAYAKDPLCEPIGTYRGVADMLLGGESLMSTGSQNWPSSIPLLIVHGEGDLVTDAAASAEFVEKVKKSGKNAEYKGFPGFYHEMHNEPGDDKWQEISFVTQWIKSKL